MTSKVTTRLRLRRDYSQLEKVKEIPNLISVQRESYERFLQADIHPDKRKDTGLQAVFKSVFPITDFNGSVSLEFKSYVLEEPRYDVRECQERGMTWAAPIKVTVQLFLWEQSDGEKRVVNIKEQEVYFGEIPLMTANGTFMINGSERVVVSQLHRSPGVFFDHDGGKTHSSGKLLYSGRIAPYRGSWLELEFDIKDVLYARIDRRRKQHATLLLRALGLTSENILQTFYKRDQFEIHKNGTLFKRLVPGQLEGQKAYKDIVADGKPIVKAGQKFNRGIVRKLTEAKIENIEVDPKNFEGLYSAYTISKAETDILLPGSKKPVVKKDQIFLSFKELSKALNINADGFDSADKFQTLTDALKNITVIIAAGEQFKLDTFDSKGRVKEHGTISQLKDIGVFHFDTLYVRENHIGESLLKTLYSDGLEPEKDDIAAHLTGRPKKESLIEIYKRIRPGDPPRIETAIDNFKNLFFNPEKYDLTPVGRIKLEFKLHNKFKVDSSSDRPKSPEDLAFKPEDLVLKPNDIIEAIRYLLELRASNDPVTYSIDDIDHLGNRRVRSVGELVENQYRLGLVRMERAIKDRLSVQDIDTLMPNELVNHKTVSAVIKEFFGSSQLSQFMDQTNPLSEITHKRRLSALGPGGLTRERAGFEVRDVHPTHYGRVCPIETPEGQNIGLISSLASFALVNQHGFIETPYRLVKDSQATKQIVYLSAMEEQREVIAQANSLLSEEGSFLEPFVAVRKNNEFVKLPASEVTMMDVSTNQLVSVAAALIPFLENDDANRALMGSNMQRQAVPLVKTSAPLVGTGMERIVARDSGAALVTKRAGVVESVEGSRIVIKSDKLVEDSADTGVDIYNLVKYQRSNQSTAINQIPIVRVGDKVAKGEIIADGQSTEMGELALGQNVLVAFMPWGGYNFEDSILISEKLVNEDAFTSIHIEEFECISRDTKLGPEEITKDIPGLGDESVSNLDESGIIRIGAEVKPGDILVGKITPKSETQLAPEEKLLRAIFGERAAEVRDTSLKLPPGVEGTVISAHVFSKKGASKDDRTLELEKAEIARLEQDQRDEIRILRESAIKQLSRMLVGKVLTSRLSDENKKQILAKGEEITLDLLESIPFEYLRDLQVGDEKLQQEVSRIVVGTGQLVNNKRTIISNKIKRIKGGDELPTGVIKMVKVFVAVKRRLSVGDKMAGRHGNKGVLSRILPVEDMPYLADGTPVDMVLNPLGVPSRMNVGQILETHLGWASYNIGRKLGQLVDSVIESYKPIKLEDSSEISSLLHEYKQRTEDTQTVTEKISSIIQQVYEDKESQKTVKNLNDVELLQLARKCRKGVHVGAPVFEGPGEDEIKKLLRIAEVDETARTTLYDGKTGEQFAEKVTVGVMYMLKLHHLVDDKIHARSTGPYSLVTQQPLGGKAQSGGQRLGEMEVWALEAYGASNTLQEFLTVKSDDLDGRNRMYEAIVKGEHLLDPGLPESFNVMCRELMSLGLNVELIEKEGAIAEEEEVVTEQPTNTPPKALEEGSLSVSA